MSARLLEFLEKIRVFTGKADRYLRAAGKALLMLVGLLILARFGRSWGQHFLTAPVIAVFTAAAAFLPAGFFTFGVFVAALGMLFQLSLEAALLMLLASLLMLVLYYSFRPHHGVIAGVFLVMVLAGFPEAALLVLPLFVTPFALIPMAFGYLGAVYLQTVAGNLSTITTAESAGETISAELLIQLAGGFVNRQVIIWFGAAAVVFTVMWLIRRQAFPFAHTVAVGAGALLWLAAVLFFGLGSVGAAVLHTVLGVLVALVVLGFRVPGDFTRTEYVEFEDDDYYYYVKAVPKLKVPLGRTQVKTFNQQDGSSR